MTAQIGDRLDFLGDSYELSRFPELPKNHPGVTELPGAVQAVAFAPTYLQRGYIARWSIREDEHLWLEAIDSEHWVLPHGPVRADWVTTQISAALDSKEDSNVPVPHIRFEVEKGSLKAWWEDEIEQDMSPNLDFEAVRLPDVLSRPQGDTPKPSTSRPSVSPQEDEDEDEECEEEEEEDSDLEQMRQMYEERREQDLQQHVFIGMLVLAVVVLVFSCSR